MNTIKRISWSVLFAMALTAALCVSGRADDDPPGRVGRINYLQGQVSFQPSGGSDSDWVTAVPNRPLTIGDRLWVDRDGRAELHVGSAAIRADRNTGISFLNLSDNSVQLQVSAGTVIVRLRRLDLDDSFEVDAPNLAFSLLRPGDYRIDVDPDQNRTVVTVQNGQGEVTGGGRSYRINPDQQAAFTGTDSLDYDLIDADATPANEFDRWAADRDRREDHRTSAKYVSPEMTGSEDLDDYGTWRVVPEYGAVWVPARVAPGWAPYRFGHWAWIPPWGWTWVEDEPWGFAPFHYGRWAYIGGVWGWVPGPVGVGVVVARPVYAPALVAWVGGGPGFHFSVSFGGGGGVGWVPLGPREVFVPAYRVSDTYVTRVNVTNTVVERNTVVNVYHNTNVTNVTNVNNVTYVNQHVGGAVTVVSHDTFVNARPVGKNIVAVPERELAAAPVSRTVAAEPVHASVIGAGRPAAVMPPAAVMNRPAVVKRSPPPVAARIEGPSNVPGGQPSNAPPARSLQPTQPSQPSQPAQPAQPNPGYRPPNRPTGQPGANQVGGNQQSGNQPRTIQPNGDENRPVGNSPSGNQPSGIQPGANQPGGGGNRPVGNLPNGNQPSGIQPGTNQPGGGGNRPVGNPPNGNQPSGIQPSGIQPGGDGNRPVGNPPSGNQPSGIQPSGIQPGGGGNRPGGNLPSGNQPRGIQQGGNQPGGGNRPYGNAPNQPKGNADPSLENSRYRTAPPPRQPTPDEQKKDNAKQQSWQQQHQQVHQNDQPPNKSDKKSDNKPDDRSKH